jgi:hypothetical protein
VARGWSTETAETSRYGFSIRTCLTLVSEEVWFRGTDVSDAVPRVFRLMKMNEFRGILFH